MLTLVSFLQKKLRRLSTSPAYIFLEKGENETARLTYGALDKKARAIAVYLQKKNLYGKSVLLCYSNTLDFITAFLGCLYSGVIAVPVNLPRENTAEFIQSITNQTDCAGIFTDNPHQPFFINKAIFITAIHEIDLNLFSAYQLPQFNQNTIAYLQYTSGSTALPKAVVIHHHHLMHNIKQTAKAWHYSKKSILLTWSPPTHVYGLVCGLLLPLYSGSRAIVIPPEAIVEKPLRWLKAITAYQVTHSGCPDFGYRLCLKAQDKKELSRLHLKSWRYAINGGESILPDTLQAFSQYYSPYGFHADSFCPAYGMSEAAGTIAVKGKLLPGMEAIIIDPDTLQCVENNKIGEIWLRGKYLASGYWRNFEETEKYFDVSLPGSNKKYFRTGDLGFIQKKVLHLTGRLKDLIIVRGKKYSPLEIENSVREALNNFSNCGIGIIFDHAGEIFFLQEIKKISGADQSAISSLIRTHVAKEYGMHLQTVLVIEENTLPRTASGKLKRKIDSEWIQSQLTFFETKKDFQEKKSMDSTPLLFIISSVLTIMPEKINLQAPLSDYALDSVTVVQLTAAINEAYDLKITPAHFFEYATFSDILQIKDRKKNIAQQQKKKVTDIAIIGMSGIFPGAPTVDILWDNLIEGKEVIQEIPRDRWHWEAYEPQIKWGGFVEDIAKFDASFFNVSPREAELIDPQHRLFLQVVWNTIENAGYAASFFSKKKMGVFVGVFSQDYAELLQKSAVQDAYLTTGVTHSLLANRISYLLNLQGPSEAIDTACSSAMIAIHHAVRAIQYGDCDTAIAGGVNALLSPTSYLAATAAGMLSADGKCKTFDEKANGYVRAEGAGAILLKPLAEAIQDHDHIYGVIKGIAINHGGHAVSLTAPNPQAQADVIQKACEEAGIDLDTISYVETHGTGTELGDPIEINGLKKIFPQHKKSYCGLGSIKTHIGHLESAAGIAGVIKVLLAMQHQKIPANLHCKKINPYIELENSPFYLVNETQAWEALKDDGGKTISRRAGVSSFGFGGTNAHVIIEEWKNEELISSNLVRPQLIALSAKTEAALYRRIAELKMMLNNKLEKIDFSALSYTLNQGREHFEKRCVIVAKSVKEFYETLIELHEKHFSEHAVISFSVTPQKKQQAIIKEFSNWLVKEIQEEKNFSEIAYRSKLLALGHLYVEGHTLDWTLLQSEVKQRIPLPGYSFEKEHHWIGHRHAFQPLSENTEAEPRLLQSISALLKMPIEKIPRTASLMELGFDSISFKELALELEKEFHMEITPTVFFTYPTVQNLIQFFKQHTPVLSTPILKRNVIPEPIAVIGMQGYFPQSKNIEDFWNHLAAGHDLISEVPISRWQDKVNKTETTWAGIVPDIDQFDAAFFAISSREANVMDPQHRLFLEVVWKTLEEAGHDPFSFSGKKVGVFAGMEFHDYYQLMQEQKKIFHGHVATGNSFALLANRISYFFNWHGPSEVIDTACSSSLVALHRAVNAIQNQECEMAIAGGVSLLLHPDTVRITNQLGALSPDSRCKTFEKTANGYVKGEGVAAILLKPLSQAEKDGDFIYGIIKSSAVNHGGKAQSLTAPSAALQSQLLVEAYTRANIDPDTVTYIETHGTGTELGDPIEIEGLKSAFESLFSQFKKQKKKNYCALGALKTNIGHLEPASGIAGLIKVLLAMKHEKIPKNLHLKEVNPYIRLEDSPFYLVNEITAWKRLRDENDNEIPRRAGVSSFGFGGTNAHVVVEEYVSTPQKGIAQPAYLITLSAKCEMTLQKKIQDLYTWLSKQDVEKINLASLAFTLNTGRTHFDFRFAVVVDSLDELLNVLETQIKTTIVSLPLINPKYDSVESVLQTIHASSLQYKEKLVFLASEYMNKKVISWDLFYQNQKMSRLPSLPDYPLSRERHWFNQEWKASSTAMLDVSPTQSVDVPSTQSVDIPHAPTVDVPRLDRGIQDFLIKETPHPTLLLYLKNIFSEKLNLSPEKISVDTTYEVYGVDSLLGLEITNRLEKDFNELPKTILYEKNKLRDLGRYLEEDYADAVQKIISGSSDAKIESILSTPDKPVMPLLFSQNDNTDIAIIGLSGTYPLANDIDTFWENLKSGRDCITEIPKDRWNSEDYPVQVGKEKKYFNYGGFISDVDKFDPLFFNIAPREAAMMDPQERVFLQTAWEVLEDAGYTREKLRHLVDNQVGVFAGVTYNFYPIFMAEEWAKGNRLPLDVQLFSIANRISYFLDLKGPSFIIDTACSSSLAAIHLAVESLQRKECMMAIAGGVNLSLHPSKYYMLGSYSFLSSNGRCTSFGEGGTGYVPSEGSGAVLLKPLHLAIRDHDRIQGVIKSSSMNHGGKTSGYTVPNPNAQAELIKSALQKSGIDPRTISYIEAHGTGTALGDPIEIRALQEAFKSFTQDKQFCAIGSVKSNIGHLESAAGISQLTKVLLQLRHKQLVPSLHAETLNPYIDFAKTPFYVQRELSEWKTRNNCLRRAGISSFGAGGTNVHLIVEEFVSSSVSNDAIQHEGPLTFMLSAMNAERLAEYIKKMEVYFDREEKNQVDKMAWLKNICYTLQTGRESMPEKYVISVSSYEDLRSQLKDVGIHRFPHHFSENKIASASVLSLPTYPFAKRRCWIPTISENQPALKSTSIPTPEFLKEWLYRTQWVNQKNNSHESRKKEGYWMTLRDQEDYQNRLDQVFLEKNAEFQGIIYFCSSTEKEIQKLFLLFQALISFRWKNKLLFCLVTENSQAISKKDSIALEQYPLWTFTRIFLSEQPNYSGLLLDFDKTISAKEKENTIFHEISHFNATDNQIAYRDSERYVIHLLPSEIPVTVNTKIPPKAALITGGLGALGAEVAQWLIEQGTQYLLLTGTTVLPDRSDWKNNTDNALKEKIEYFLLLEKYNVDIRYVVVDVADKIKMQEAILEAEKNWGRKITGVFHLAGITTPNITIETLSEALLHHVVSVKKQGALVLHELFQRSDCQYFVLFSSIAALPYFGMSGLSAYAVANAFLDGLALHRRHQGLPAMSINWAAWADKGMSFRYDHSRFLDAVGMSTVSIQDGLELLKFLLWMPEENTSVFKIEWNKFFRMNAETKKLAFFSHFSSLYIDPEKEKKVTSHYSREEIATVVVSLLAKLLSLELHEIDLEASYQQYGLDSIIGVYFVSELGEHFTDVVSPMDLYRYTSVNQLTDYIFQSYSVSQPVEDSVMKNILHLSDAELKILIEEELKEMEI